MNGRAMGRRPVNRAWVRVGTTVSQWRSPLPPQPILRAYA
jgi:hypothetical protein